MKNIIKLSLAIISLIMISCASDPDYMQLDRFCDGNFAYYQDKTNDRSLTIKCWENSRGEGNVTNRKGL